MKDKFSTKNKIVTSMFELLKNKSFDDINVKDICADAGVSRMTYYRNFHSKKDVLAYRFDSAFTTFVQRLATSHSHNLTDIATIFFELIKEDQTMMEIIIKNNLSMFLLENLKRYISTLINEEVLETREQSSKLLVSLIAGGLTEIIITWTEDGMREPIQSLVIFVSKYMHFKIN
ncbi:TetR/AcrR family transcriptional regulator [Apilactobacillus ozensis]|uniref:TetR/AcrR family transcriptional regulator n=1 Tax=Apilactobacillus ozensis TaxID=866801 RepID=UPI00200A4BC7|nr:TetR/AcrR family transcriptional regulator [Apilactobacillus ozensis]MCK8606785.1 TetR/AcrR family transcriptional regulator [Apilactobacillus ozensis]